MKCPSCKTEIPKERPESWPFCTKRCKMIDLGKWVNEEYAIPVRQAPSEEEIEELESALRGRIKKQG